MREKWFAPTDQISLRVATLLDEPIQSELYFASRPELQQVNVDAANLHALVKMQQQIQLTGIRQHYPNAQTFMIDQSAQGVGQLILDDAPTDIRVIDIVILPEARGKGLAKAVMRALLAEAIDRNLPVSLAVRIDNTIARSLYLSLGFAVLSSDGLFEQMIWHPVQTDSLGNPQR